MQKFTVFSIILSLSVVLIIGDILLNDYGDKQKSFVQPTLNEEENIENLNSDDIRSDFGNDLEGQEFTNEEGQNENLKDSDLNDEDVNLSSESIELKILTPYITEDIFGEAGFANPRLKDTIYSGFVFQFLPFKDSEAFVYQWNLFEEEIYIGSVYEIKYSNDTAGFQAYLKLRQAGLDQSALGSVNEANNYGDSSFYFNHVSKTQTVHAVIRRGDTLYAFEYPYKKHEIMKRVFEQL